MADAIGTEARCRPIEDADLEAVIDCLVRNFPERSRDYWRNGLAAMARCPRLAGFPCWGYLLEADRAIVGVLLQIGSTREDANGSSLRSNLSSWCVDEAYRGFAYILHRRSVSRVDATYVNISAAPHTHRMIEALGFRRYAAGLMVFAPLLSRGAPGARVVEYREERPEAAMLKPAERRLLADHAAFGCRALIGVRDGVATPIVLQWRSLWRGNVPAAHVLYCPSEEDLVPFARALGFYCARRGRLFVFVDATGPVAGLVGGFFPGREPRYFKGPSKPTPCDLAYTELAILGR
jgi:hypothetical protein